MIEFTYLLLSLLIFGVANFLRKLVADKVDVEVAAFMEVAIALPLLLLISAYTLGTGMESFDIGYLPYAFVSALLIFGGLVFFYKALQNGFVSIVTTVVNMNGVVAASLGFILLAEAFDIYIGTGIFLAFAVIYLLKPSEKIKKGIWLHFALFSMLCFGLNNFVIKLFSTVADYFVGYTIIQVFLLLLLAIPLARYATKRRKITIPRETLPLLVAISFMVAASFMLFFISVSTVPLSIAAPVVNMNLVITVLLGAFVLKEKLGRKALLAIALSVASVILLA